MEITFHYPPELMNLLIETIPKLCRSKSDLLLFFTGAGVGHKLTDDLAMQVSNDRSSINKYEITRTILTRLNEKGEATLRQRREVVKRITEFEDYSTCWPDDQLEAMGLVAEIRRVVHVKDSFTRMAQERDEEKKLRLAQYQKTMDEVQKKRTEIGEIKKALNALFAETNAWKRGKALEGVLNRLFKASAILIREAFTLKGIESEGIIEQIDGVIELEGHVYLVEMKWWDSPLGRAEVSEHLVRVFSRGHACGIFISASSYTEPAIVTCREALQRCIVVLCNLEELVMLLDQERDLKEFLKSKVNAAIIDKNPLFEPLRNV